MPGRDIRDEDVILQSLVQAEGARVFKRLDNEVNLNEWEGDIDSWTIRNSFIHGQSVDKTITIRSKKPYSKSGVIRVYFWHSPGAKGAVLLHGREIPLGDVRTPEYMSALNQRRDLAFADELEVKFERGVAVVRVNGHIISSEWKLGDDVESGIGLVCRHGTFEFKYLRLLDFAEEQITTYSDYITNRMLPDQIIR